LVSCPADKVEEFPGAMAIVNLGVGDFEFRFIIDCYWWGWGLNTFGDQVQE